MLLASLAIGKTPAVGATEAVPAAGGVVLPLLAVALSFGCFGAVPVGAVVTVAFEFPAGAFTATSGFSAGSTFTSGFPASTETFGCGVVTSTFGGACCTATSGFPGVTVTFGACGCTVMTGGGCLTMICGPLPAAGA